LKIQFATLKPIIDDSSPAKPSSPERWGPKPEITHTFRQPQKLPNKALSGLFALAVIAGLPLFLILVSSYFWDIVVNRSWFLRLQIFRRSALH